MGGGRESTSHLTLQEVKQGLDDLWEALKETQLGSHPEICLLAPGPWHVQHGRERLCPSVPRIYFSVSSSFRRLNDPSIVTPFSRDDRGHTPLHVAALCGMWFCVGLWLGF